MCRDREETRGMQTGSEGGGRVGGGYRQIGREVVGTGEDQGIRGQEVTCV